MKYLIAIDVGIRNLGLCVFNFECSKIVFWDNVALVKGKYMPSDNVHYVKGFVERFKPYFDEAACVLIERQMRCNMRIVESVLHSLFYENTIIINPKSIKTHYNLGTKNYKLNKEKAVEWADLFVGNNSDAFVPNCTTPFLYAKKKDDLADSLLMICYYLDTYSNQNDTRSIDFVFAEDGIL